MVITTVVTMISVFVTSCIHRAFFESPYQSWVYQLQNVEPQDIASAGFDLAVIDYSRNGNEDGEFSFEEINTIFEAGTTPIAYVSIGQAENYRFYWKKEWDKNPPDWLGEEDPHWPGNFFVRYWYPEWQKIVFSYIDKIISQGFKGVYLDRVDSFEYWSDIKGEIRKEEAALEMIDFVLNIIEYTREKDPDFIVIPQNAESIIDFDNGELISSVSGWAVEHLFYFKTTPLPFNETRERIKYLDTLKVHGKFILVVDYVDDGGNSFENLERIKNFYRQAKNKGYVPYAAESDLLLDEINIVEDIQPKR
ncbi:hypothetical protein AS005_03315 [Thermotoga sp. KOL6]|nr:hypothetical protein AS005_03315 [Thermotoga sp. KOL6]